MEGFILAKLQDILGLAKFEAKVAAGSPQDWMRYLDTASRLYRYSFSDTLLIHAQRRDATACAELEVWNEKMMRWVKVREALRNPTEVLRNLSEKTKNETYRFQRLYRNLYNLEFYWLAYRNIYANTGSMTAGADGTDVGKMQLTVAVQLSYLPEQWQRMTLEVLEKSGINITEKIAKEMTGRKK